MSVRRKWTFDRCRTHMLAISPDVKQHLARTMRKSPQVDLVVAKRLPNVIKILDGIERVVLLQAAMSFGPRQAVMRELCNTGELCLQAVSRSSRGASQRP